MKLETSCEHPAQINTETKMPELWQRDGNQWNDAAQPVWYQQVGVWSDGQSLHVNFQTNQTLDGATLVSTVDGGAMAERRWTESSVVLTMHEVVWEVSAAMPPCTTAWFVNLRSGGLTTSSDLIDLG